MKRQELCDTIYAYILHFYDTTGDIPSRKQIAAGCYIGVWSVDKALLFLNGWGKLDGRFPVERKETAAP